jgi:uncharacterized membrane protein
LTATTSSPAAVGGSPASSDEPGAPPRRWPHVLGVGLIVSVYTALYSTYLLVLHATLKDGMADVAEYDQAISGYAHFSAPHSPFVGLPDIGSAGALQLSDHFTPLLALLAPFYWIHDGPETLLIETAVLTALPIIPLWLFTRRAVGDRHRRFGTIAAYLVVIGYGVTWPLQMALWFEFHEVFLALPIMMWMIERAQAGRLRQAALVSLLLLGVKDDLGFVVAVFGIYLATKNVTLRDWWRLLRHATRDRARHLRNAVGRNRREAISRLRHSHRVPYLALVPIGLAMVALVNKVLLPEFGGSSTRNFTYTEFGATPGAALKTMLQEPGTVLGTLVNSPFKTQTLSMLLWPVLGLCLLSPITLMAAPLLIERFLSVNNLYWVMPYHYNAFLLPIMLCGGVDGAVRLSRRLTTAKPAASRIGRHGPLIRNILVTSFAAYVAIQSWSTAFRYPMHHMTEAAFWDTGNPDVVAAKIAASHVPDNVLVASATQIGPHLLSRDRVIMWSFPGDRGYPVTPWVLADVQRASYPFASVDAQKADVEWLKTKGYRVVFQLDGWVVLHQG